MSSPLRPPFSAETESNSNLRLRLAVEVAQLGTYEWDMVHDRMSFDAAALEILGVLPGTAVGNLEEAFRLVHPLDLPLLQNSLAETIAGAQHQTRQFRIVRPDGSQRWVASKGKILRDAGGKAVLLIAVLQDINDLKCAEEVLRTQADRLHHLSRQLLTAQEMERRRVARELHDEIGQGLTAAMISLQLLQHRPEAAPIAQDLAEAATWLDTTLQQVRTMSLELRPALLDDLGLVSALRWHLDRVGQRTGLQIHLEAQRLEQRLPIDVEIVCYRVVQEALTNIVRHAGARHVRVEVEVEHDGSAVRATIADDGRGFELPAALARAQAGGSLGLLSMEERVKLLDGTLHIQTSQGEGCHVSLRLPLPSASPSAEIQGTEALP